VSGTEHGSCFGHRFCRSFREQIYIGFRELAFSHCKHMMGNGICLYICAGCHVKAGYVPFVGRKCTLHNPQYQFAALVVCWHSTGSTEFGDIKCYDVRRDILCVPLQFKGTKRTHWRRM
jgi:hypothetical protein